MYTIYMQSKLSHTLNSSNNVRQALRQIYAAGSVLLIETVALCVLDDIFLN